MKFTINRALELVQEALNNSVRGAEQLRELTECMATIRAEIEEPPSYDDAWRVIEADYWDDVRSVDAKIRRMVKDGELTEESELYDAIHEACENTQRVIYTHQAKVGLCCTNNPDAYEEEIGDKPETVEAQMCMALIADVTARLDDIEWPREEEETE